MAVLLAGAVLKAAAKKLRGIYGTVKGVLSGWSAVVLAQGEDLLGRNGVARDVIRMWESELD